MITPSFSLTATERVLPRLALDFTTASLDPRVTFTRTGNTATVVNSSGFVEAVNADIPRFDFDPITKICKGLLIEETRINVQYLTEDIASWTQVGGAVDVTPATSPNGTANAYKFVENSLSGAHNLRLNSTLTNQVYTASIYVKAAGRTRFEFGGLALNCGRGFDLSNGTTFANTVGLAEPTSFSITNVGDGWYRCSITGTSPGGSSSFRYYLNDGTSFSYTGNGTDGMYFWGAQLEAGAFMTSYIPNAGASGTTVTRNADIATMTGTNFSDWWSGLGSVTTSVRNVVKPNYSTAVMLDNGSGLTNNAIMLQSNANNSKMDVVIYTAGGATKIIDTQAFSTTATKMAMALNTNYVSYATQGAAATVDTGALALPTVDRCVFGYEPRFGNFLNGCIEKFAYYSNVLTANEVQAFSK